MAKIKDLMDMCRHFNDCNLCPLCSDRLCHPMNYPDDIDKIIEKWKYKQDVIKIPSYIYSSICKNLCINELCNKHHECGDYDCEECWNRWLSEIKSEVE